MSDPLTVLVLGAGISGMAAIRLLLREGHRVILADERAFQPGFQIPDELAGASVEIVAEVDDAVANRVALAVISPGIAWTHPWRQRLAAASVRIIPEFAYGVMRLPHTRVIAITGSNGKTSVVKWIADTLVAAGIRAVPAGNYGTPPCELVLQGTAPEVVVLELSSFQLEQVESFKPEVAVLLNLTPNHLDRHHTFDAYARAKANLFAHPADNMLMLVHAPAWSLIRDFAPAGCRPVLFGEGPEAVYRAEGKRLFRRGTCVVDLSGTWWGRSPLVTNAAAALAVFDRFGIAPECIRASAETFVPLPHRLEWVADVGGVQFINDSKASTLTALAAAVAAGSEKKHLIAGGILKESDVNFVKEVVANHCAFVYGIGTASSKLVQAWNDVVAGEDCGDLPHAFAQAVRRAKAGEVILLSPGCSSFDQFSGYGQRGDMFKKLVRDYAQVQTKRTNTIMQGVEI